MEQNELIKELFFDNPTTKFQLREISRRTKISLTSVKRHVDELIKERLVILAPNTIYSSYTANRESDDFLFRKKLNNILRLHESGVLNYIRDNCNPDAIILYGSYSRGEDIENSDIDLLIISQNEELKFEKFEEMLHRKINAFFSENVIKLSYELRSNIVNGIVVYGYLDAYEPDKSDSGQEKSEKHTRNSSVDREKTKRNK